MQPEINVDKLIQQDRSEYAHLVEAYSDRIYRMTLRMTGNDTGCRRCLTGNFH